MHSTRISPPLAPRPARAAFGLATVLTLLGCVPCALALERPGVEFKIFQFPADRIPRIDGDPADWSIIPATYTVGLDELRETPDGRRPNPDRKSLDVKVKVGWGFKKRVSP